MLLLIFEMLGGATLNTRTSFLFLNMEKRFTYLKEEKKRRSFISRFLIFFIFIFRKYLWSQLVTSLNFPESSKYRCVKVVLAGRIRSAGRIKKVALNPIQMAVRLKNCVYFTAVALKF